MADNKVQYIISIDSKSGEANIKKIKTEFDKTSKSVSSLKEKLASFGKIAMGVDYIVKTFNVLSGAVSQCSSAWEAQTQMETKLAAVMNNTMDATQNDVQSILDLASAQQKLGVVGDEVQLAGAQELATYLGKKESLEQLLPVMNDMLAQQYGLNATQETAVNIATMMGKVMDGQVGALSRYGYKFDEAQEKILKFGTEEQRAATLAEVVSASVGGVNAALAQTDAGKLKQASNNFGDLQEQFGKFIEKIKIASTPLLEIFIGFAEKLLPILDTVVQPITEVVQWLVDKINWLVPILEKMFAPAVTIFHQLFEETGTFAHLWNTIGNLFKTSILPQLQNIFSCIFDIVGAVIEWIQQSELIKDVITLVGDLIGGLVEIISGVFSLLRDLFLGVIMPILDGFEWVYRKIKELITGKPVKVEERKTTTQNTNQKTTMEQIVGSTNAGTNGGTENLNKTLSSTVTATATGGTRNTQITINLGKFMDNMVFNGGYDENRQDIEQHFREMLLRTLYAAQIS